MKIPNFLKRDGLSLLYNEDGELIFYIPDLYFERDFAIIDGDIVSLLGLFNYARFDKNDKLIGDLRLFKFPSIFMCRPYDIEKKRNIKLTKNSLQEDYRLLKFKKNDVVVFSTKIPQSTDNIEIFLKMMNTGKVPNSIPYEELPDIIMENIELNGESYPVSAQLIGVVVSELARDIKDVTRPYRLSNSDDPNAYRMLNIKDIPKLVSPFTSTISENWDESMVNAITLGDKDYKKSPLERLFLI